MTNRQWLETLSAQELAEFLTCGIYVKLHYPIVGNLYTVSEMAVSIRDIASRYIQSHEGIALWLNEKQEFEVIKNI